MSVDRSGPPASAPLPAPAGTPPTPTPTPPPDSVPRIASDALLRGSHEVLIEHRGALYRLRQTALGKLILTK